MGRRFRHWIRRWAGTLGVAVLLAAAAAPAADQGQPGSGSEKGHVSRQPWRVHATRRPWLIVNGRNIWSARLDPPHYHDGRLFGPLQAIAAALGIQAEVAEDGRLRLDGRLWQPRYGNPHRHGGEWYVAVRDLAEASGAALEWNAEAQTATVRGGPVYREGPSGAAALANLVQALITGRVRVVELTATLSEDTPVIQLPPPLANTPGFRRHIISFFDERGPQWAWYWYEVGEHVGTHFDAPCHWISGRDKACLHEIPPHLLIGPAVVIDISEKVARNPDYLASVADIEAWESRYGPIPAGSWVLLRTGWAKRLADPSAYFNADQQGPHTPGPGKDFTQALIERNVLGLGVETVGTDAGQAFRFKPPFPNHFYMHGSNKFGLTQLINLDQLPPAGAVVIALPMRTRGGTGSPVRVIALVPADPKAARGGPARWTRAQVEQALPAKKGTTR